MDMSLSELRELVIHGVSKSRTRLSDWTKLNWAERAQAGSKIRVETRDSGNSQNNSEKGAQSWKTYLKLTMTLQ